MAAALHRGDEWVPEFRCFWLDLKMKITLPGWTHGQSGGPVERFRISKATSVRGDEVKLMGGHTMELTKRRSLSSKDIREKANRGRTAFGLAMGHKGIKVPELKDTNSWIRKGMDLGKGEKI
ncbi:hypothetical protein THAOC_26282, partial [Thalassiosira oceanica]